MNVEAKESASPILTATNQAELLCHLPAVATQDWCNRAAACLATVRHPSLVGVQVARIQDDGRVLGIEACGVVASAAGRNVERLSGPWDSWDGGSSRDPRLDTLRSRLEHMDSLGFRPEGGVVSVRATSAASGTPWENGPLGTVWADLGVSDLLLGSGLIEPTKPNRRLIVQLALTGANAAWRHPEIEVVAAGFRLLLKRAALALSTFGSDQGAWLTSKEQDVLERLALGHSVRRIAEALDRSEHTVHDHVKALHRKLHASSRGELIARALGYIGPDAGAPAKAPQPAVSGEVAAPA